MDNKEIALRLTEAWAKQEGAPVTIKVVFNSYKYVLEKLNKAEE